MCSRYSVRLELNDQGRVSLHLETQENWCQLLVPHNSIFHPIRLHHNPVHGLGALDGEYSVSPSFSDVLALA